MSVAFGAVFSVLAVALVIPFAVDCWPEHVFSWAIASSLSLNSAIWQISHSHIARSSSSVPPPLSSMHTTSEDDDEAAAEEVLLPITITLSSSSGDDFFWLVFLLAAVSFSSSSVESPILITSSFLLVFAESLSMLMAALSLSLEAALTLESWSFCMTRSTRTTSGASTDLLVAVPTGSSSFFSSGPSSSPFDRTDELVSCWRDRFPIPFSLTPGTTSLFFSLVDLALSSAACRAATSSLGTEEIAPDSWPLFSSIDCCLFLASSSAFASSRREKEALPEADSLAWPGPIFFFSDACCEGGTGTLRRGDELPAEALFDTAAALGRVNALAFPTACSLIAFALAATLLVTFALPVPGFAFTFADLLPFPSPGSLAKVSSTNLGAMLAVGRMRPMCCCFPTAQISTGPACWWAMV